jgi:hypothetical protein
MMSFSPELLTPTFLSECRRGAPLQPEADPSEAPWRKKHARMTDSDLIAISHRAAPN